MEKATPKQQVFILKGLPASGKSTYAKKLLAEGENTWKRVNKDDLRAMVDGGKWSKNREKFILKLRDQLILTYLDNGFNVVVDDTNLHPKHSKHIKELVGDKAECTVIAFYVPLKECMRRDCFRPGYVGPKVILSMYNQFLNTTDEKLQIKDLPFNPYYLRYDNRNWFETNKYKRKAIICDIDGTLAHMWSRTPFQLWKVKEDYLNLPIAQIIKILATQMDIIIVTGRSGTQQCKEDTLGWLQMHNIPYTAFYMRPPDDNRSDYIIKKEIYDNHIKSKYDVVAVFDDRDQVVNLWRQLGITCLQVDYGNF